MKLAQPTYCVQRYSYPILNFPMEVTSQYMKLLFCNFYEPLIICQRFVLSTANVSTRERTVVGANFCTLPKPPCSKTSSCWCRINDFFLMTPLFQGLQTGKCPHLFYRTSLAILPTILIVEAPSPSHTSTFSEAFAEEVPNMGKKKMHRTQTVWCIQW